MEPYMIHPNEAAAALRDLYPPMNAKRLYVENWFRDIAHDPELFAPDTVLGDDLVRGGRIDATDLRFVARFDDERRVIEVLGWKDPKTGDQFQSWDYC